jgi:predicted O-methyltransferase YrrM
MKLEQDSEEQAKTLVKRISCRLDGFSEMTTGESVFLTQLLLQTRPRKILELGVSAGGSSALILNAIQDLPDTVFHSVEYSATWWRGTDLPSGFLIEKRFPDWCARWQLHLPGTAAEFMQEIGGGIDFCLIDTVHLLPGEVLDFLMVLPYLAPDAVVVIHDIALQTVAPLCYSNILLFQSLRGNRLLPDTTDREGFPFPNIGAVCLTQEQEAVDLFRLLTLPWLHYMPTAHDLSAIRSLFAQHYEPKLLALYDYACAANAKMWRSPVFRIKCLKAALRMPLTNLALKLGLSKTPDVL